MQRFLAGGQRDDLHVLARLHRRVDQQVESHGLKGDGVRGLFCDWQRGTELPAAWHSEFGLKCDLVSWPAGRVEQHLVPHQNEQLR